MLSQGRYPCLCTHKCIRIVCTHTLSIQLETLSLQGRKAKELIPRMVIGTALVVMWLLDKGACPLKR